VNLDSDSRESGFMNTVNLTRESRFTQKPGSGSTMNTGLYFNKPNLSTDDKIKFTISRELHIVNQS